MQITANYKAFKNGFRKIGEKKMTCLGFRSMGVRKNPKTGEKENAIVFYARAYTGRIPKEVIDLAVIQNNTDTTIDYFEVNRFVVFESEHKELYNQLSELVEKVL